MREQQSVRPAPPRRMSAKQMNSSLLSGILNGCNGHRADGHSVPLASGPSSASRRTRTIIGGYRSGPLIKFTIGF
jgi:hypothetical protein